MSVIAKCLKYTEYGEPANVLKIFTDHIQNPGDDEVLVKVLAAPIHPFDIRIVQGNYPVKPKLPAIGGNEFVADVVSVGKNVTNFKAGDRVIANQTFIGTWTSHAVYAATDLLKISNHIGIAEAATIDVNPCTAYRMLKDFVNLKPGDVVIQNGANSAVGQVVHQLCKAWNISSVGVVRDRPDIAELKAYLKSLGATEVLTEEELTKTDLFKGKLPKPKLGLNCVGGKSATLVASHLDDKGILVTYGSITKEPVTASTETLIYRDISYVGFWKIRWAIDNVDSEERKQMFAELSKLLEERKLIAPAHEMVPLDKYKNAFTAAVNSKGFIGKKFILDFQNC